MKRRILIVEDHAAFREALITVLNREPDLKVIGQAGSLAEGRAFTFEQEIDVAVVDIFLPDGSGVKLVLELRQAAPHLWIVVLTAGLDHTLHAQALQAGADEVCVKAAGIEEVIEAIGGIATNR